MWDASHTVGMVVVPTEQRLRPLLPLFALLCFLFVSLLIGFLSVCILYIIAKINYIFIYKTLNIKRFRILVFKCVSILCFLLPLIFLYQFLHCFTFASHTSLFLYFYLFSIIKIQKKKKKTFLQL